jgi:hypothetical protein
VAKRKTIDALGATALALAGTFVHAQSGPEREHARFAAWQQGNALATALLGEDFAAVAASACSPVLARVGGALALARQIEVSYRVMRQQGRQLVQMQFGAATSVVEGDATRFALLPYRSVVRVRDGRVSIESYFLGVQDKDADAWCFIDTAALTAQSLREMFPGAPAGLQLPPPAPAVIERDAPEDPR